jgi:rubrerythrin
VQRKRTPNRKRGLPATSKKRRNGSREGTFSDETKAVVRARSGNKCEVRASVHCTGRGEHFHHRLLRRFGDHTAENALHVCNRCHAQIHANPSWSHARGWLIRGNGPP